MLLLTTTPPNRRGFDKLTARRSMVDVVALEEYGYEAKGMVVEMRANVRANPMMEPNGVAKE